MVKNTASYEYFNRLRNAEKKIYEYWVELGSGSTNKGKIVFIKFYVCALLLDITICREKYLPNNAPFVGPFLEIDVSAQLATWKYPVTEIYTTMTNRMEKWGLLANTQVWNQISAMLLK